VSGLLKPVGSMNVVQEEVERFLTEVAAPGSAPSSPTTAGNKRKGLPTDEDGGRAKAARGATGASVGGSSDDLPMPGPPGRCWRLGPYDKVGGRACATYHAAPRR
jgi:hypothetical protein